MASHRLRKVAVVVLNHNGRMLAEKCLRSVMDSSHSELDIIVVDNASSDDSVAYLRALFPNVTILEKSENLGVAGGRNCGFREAVRRGNDYILSLDNDAHIDRHLIDKLVEAADSDARIGVVGPKTYVDDGSGKIQCAGGRIAYTQNVCSERGSGEIDRGQYGRIEDVDYFPGFGFMARREVFERLNFLDESFYGYGHEDTDFCIRSVRLGYRVLYVPEAVMWHRGSTTIGSYSPRKKYLEAINSVSFVRKYGTRKNCLKYAFFAGLGLIYALVVQSLRGNQQAVFAKARGLWDGLHKAYAVTPVTSDQRKYIQNNDLVKSSWRKAISWGLCLCFSGILLYLAVRQTNISQVKQFLKGADASLALTAVIFLLLSFLVRAWRWHYLLKPLKVIPIGFLFQSALIGTMSNYLLPLRAGELVRAVYIGQAQKISKAGVLGSVVLERVLDGVTLSTLLFLLLTVLDVPPWLVQLNILLLGIYVAGLSIFMVSVASGQLDIWLKRLKRLLPLSFGSYLSATAGHFFLGMKTLKGSGCFLPVFLLSPLCWFLHVMYYFVLAEALGLSLTLPQALMIECFIAIGVMLPAGPGYVGNFEYSAILGLSLFGVGKEEAFAYALIAHSLQIIPVTAIGLVFVLRVGFWPWTVKGEPALGSLPPSPIS